MASIKDSTRTTVAEHSIEMQVETDNLLNLTPEQTSVHLKMLSDMLVMKRKLIYKKLPREGGSNIELLEYLKNMGRILDIIALKNRLESAKPSTDIRLSCTIDPTDSGFPLFARDFRFLRTDREKADQELGKIPDNERLVDDALFLLFRGHFPRDVILQKLAREYYEELAKSTLPDRIEIHPETLIKEEDNIHFCKQSFERLDDHSNVPRFYTMYLKIPSKTYARSGWRDEILTAIKEGLSTVTNLELMYLAKLVEIIEGVQLDCIERFDIGPFYNTCTKNTGIISSLIEADDECMIMFRKYSIIRAGETKRTGLVNKFRGWRSGDDHLGEFTPVIASPQYILMPHRLIQKVHNRDLSINNTKMFDITDAKD
ncbi:MAG: hypothetical protein GY795_49135 [Desulfobacterales bacterium]|nr:hypothetical protein [Desulfobacterales bacterium]